MCVCVCVFIIDKRFPLSNRTVLGTNWYCCYEKKNLYLI